MSSPAPSIPAWPASAPIEDERGSAGPRRPLALLALMVALAVLAPVLAPHSPEAIDLAHRHAAPSLFHWFGTDELGRDLLSRVLYGARVSLAVGLVSAALSGIVGLAIGLAAGYAGGWIDDVLMRFTETMLAIPRLPLLMVAAAIAQPSVPMLVLLVGAVGWMETARVSRAGLLSLRKQEFAEAARAMGAGGWRIVTVHLLPNVAPVVAVSTTLAVGQAILLESAMSFLGVGVQPPTASWGSMLYQAQTAMTTEPWIAIFPGLCIFVTVMTVNQLGDALSQRRH